MHPDLHLSVAFIVSSLVTRKTYLTIALRHKRPSMFVGDINEQIDLRDFDRGSRLVGEYQQGKWQIRDEKTGHLITLEIEGNTFQGYDTESKYSFHGSVDRDRVFLFDQQTRSRYVFVAHPERTTCRPRVLRPMLPDQAKAS